MQAAAAKGQHKDRFGAAACRHIDGLQRPALTVHRQCHPHTACITIAIVAHRGAQLYGRIGRRRSFQRFECGQADIRWHRLHASHVLDNDFDLELFQAVQNFIQAALARCGLRVGSGALVRFSTAQVDALLQVRQHMHIQLRARIGGIVAGVLQHVIQRRSQVDDLIRGLGQAVEHAACLFGSGGRQQARCGRSGDQTHAVAARRIRFAGQGARTLECRFPRCTRPGRLAHGSRAVHHDDQLAPRFRQASQRTGLTRERACQGKGQESHGESAQEQQQPLFELHTPACLAPGCFHKAHRSPRKGTMVAAIQQVDRDGDRCCQQAKQQRGVGKAAEEVHRPRPPLRMRAVRAASQADRTTSTPRSVRSCTTSARKARASRARASP